LNTRDVNKARGVKPRPVNQGQGLGRGLARTRLETRKTEAKATDPRPIKTKAKAENAKVDFSSKHQNYSVFQFQVIFAVL